MIKKIAFCPQSEKCNGFTIIELVVAFSVIIVLSLAGIAASVSYSRAQSLTTAVQELKSVLNQAKSYAQSQYKPDECEDYALEGYKVTINESSDEYALFPICGDVDLEMSKKSLPNDVEFGEAAGNSSGYFTFPVLTGGINGDGLSSSPWEIRLISSQESDRFKIITISSNGSIR